MRVLHDHLRRRLLRHPWAVALLASVLLFVGLMHRKFGLWGSAFLARDTLDWWETPLFLIAIAVYDLTLLMTAQWGWTALSRLLKRSDLFERVSFIVVSTLFVLIGNIVAYNLLAYLGDWVRLRATVAIAGGVKGAAPYVLETLPTLLPVMLLAAIATAIGTWIAWRWLRGAPTSSRVSLLKQSRAVLLLWTLTLLIHYRVTRSPADAALARSVRRTVAYQLMGPAMATATNFDRDACGWLDFPPDFAPFDARRHPFAREIPNNGIDENGLAGDLQTLIRDPVYPAPTETTATPDIVVLVECSFRTDALFSRDGSPSAMPTLSRLARDHFHHENAYSHSGYTTSSLKEICTGSVWQGRSSIVRDFRTLGYQVGVFSSDSGHFGDLRQACGWDAAHRYFDAEHDPDARVTKYSAPSSMFLPATRVLREAKNFLIDLQTDQPYFVFIFIATTHFPYDLDSPDALIAHDHVNAQALDPKTRDDLRGMYDNATANLDQRIADLLETLDDHAKAQERDRPVLMILGDHGESLFDDGTLGHGTILNDVQTRVPLVIVDGWGEVPTPFGHTDVRPYLLQLVSTPKPASARVALRPADRPVFQYCGPWMMPLQIAHITSRGRFIVDLTDRAWTDPSGSQGTLKNNPPAEALKVVHRWESLRLTN